MPIAAPTRTPPNPHVYQAGSVDSIGERPTDTDRSDRSGQAGTTGAPPRGEDGGTRDAGGTGQEPAPTRALQKDSSTSRTRGRLAASDRTMSRSSSSSSQLSAAVTVAVRGLP